MLQRKEKHRIHQLIIIPGQPLKSTERLGFIVSNIQATPWQHVTIGALSYTILNTIYTQRLSKVASVVLCLCKLCLIQMEYTNVEVIMV